MNCPGGRWFRVCLSASRVPCQDLKLAEKPSRLIYWEETRAFRARPHCKGLEFSPQYTKRPRELGTACKLQRGRVGSPGALRVVILLSFQGAAPVGFSSVVPQPASKAWLQTGYQRCPLKRGAASTGRWLGAAVEGAYLLYEVVISGFREQGRTLTSRQRPVSAWSVPDSLRQESLNRHRYLNSWFPHENSTASYGINQFSNLFPEEFKAIYLRSKPSRLPRYPAKVRASIPNTSLPLRFDWRDKHVVTPVRNQQMCGGCWAFSVVGAVESAWAIRGQPLEDLSAQQVIDCSYNNFGCNGGSPVSALSWLNKTRVKLVRDSEYPFKAQNGLCHYFSRSQPGLSIQGYSAYDFSDQEAEMARALLTLGPLVAIVDAVSWQDYLGGIVQHHCSSGSANHAVLITGFDRTGSTPYWIVRNSWGSSWGVGGYIYIKMGSNMCGIADSVAAVFL
ncbi:cathepsin O [Fukomys damarensis]|uniref:cathepsin O n=1 Tax=Fukomys damarensis TaxID=885580 RepID=UPI00053F498A|nr:cathepsin O [Fukomys damarensis]